MKSLSINLESFGFVQREERNGKPIIFRCGRDFLYYALAYYKPDEFTPFKLCPKKIESEGMFGLRVPWWLMWSGLQLATIPSLLKDNNLRLEINGKTINNYFDFLTALALPHALSAQNAISAVEQSVDRNEVSAIDIGISVCGLVDHVLFVYAYDKEDLLVFDTQKIPILEYEKQTPHDDKRFIMKLPKNIVRKRWTRWGRVWKVVTI